jgi:hypothetical protein
MPRFVDWLIVRAASVHRGGEAPPSIVAAVFLDHGDSRARMVPAKMSVNPCKAGGQRREARTEISNLCVGAHVDPCQ